MMGRTLIICGAISIAGSTVGGLIAGAFLLWINGAHGDWLGFAGGAIGGLMTLIAAAVAWLSVERQIRLERKATADQLSNAFAIQRGFALNLKHLADTIIPHTAEIVVNEDRRLARYGEVHGVVQALAGLPAIAPSWKDAEITFGISPYKVIPALRACIGTEEELLRAMKPFCLSEEPVMRFVDVQTLHSAAVRSGLSAELALAQIGDAEGSHHSAASG